MRIGFSLLLSDYVTAAEADYEDCATFGLVCPCCSEAVFKRVRPTSAGETHYFAHYKADPQAAERCDLRVSSLTPQQLDAASTQARGQNLSVFLQHFQKALLMQYSGVYTGDARALEDARKMLVRKSVSDGIGVYAKHLLHNLQRVSPEKRRCDVAEIIDGTFPEDSALLRSHRVRNTLDMIEHLVTPQARGNLAFLTAFLFAVTAKLAPSGAPRSPYDVVCTATNAVYVNADNAKRMRRASPALNDAYERLRLPGDPPTLDHAIVWTALSSLYTTLGELPYLTWLREARPAASRPMEERPEAEPALDSPAPL